jgi:hypothetical protein
MNSAAVWGEQVLDFMRQTQYIARQMGLGLGSGPH